MTKKNNEYFSFSCSGHAGFARKGKDIVCASVSVLTINTFNSIDVLTTCTIKGNEQDGFLEWEFVSGCDRDATLLMDSMVLGLNEISKEYADLLSLEVKEV